MAFAKINDCLDSFLMHQGNFNEGMFQDLDLETPIDEGHMNNDICNSLFEDSVINDPSNMSIENTTNIN